MPDETPDETPGAPRPVTRRHFLAVALPALGAALLAVTGGAAFDWFGLRTWTAWQWRELREHTSAYRYAFLPADRRIRKHFADLTIDEAGLQRFVRDYEKHVGRVKFYSVSSNGLLFSKFLLSTDYYRNGADPKKPVHYVAFFDPYVTPCWNPFVRA
jgi:hypothetical protein